MTKEKNTVINSVRHWVEKVVIGLNLCPFAKQPYDLGIIRFEAYLEDDMTSQLEAIAKEVGVLINQPKLSNSLISFPNGLDDFDTFLDFVYLAERLLEQQSWEEDFQLANFHPDYRFEGTEADVPSNYTNRAPYPVIHIIRTEEMAEAIASYPDVEKVSENNIKKMNELGVEGIKALLLKK